MDFLKEETVYKCNKCGIYYGTSLLLKATGCFQMRLPGVAVAVPHFNPIALMSLEKKCPFCKSRDVEKVKGWDD